MINIGLFYLPQEVMIYLESLIVLIVAIFVIGTIGRLVKKHLRATNLPEDMQNILRRCIVYVLWYIILIYIIELLEIKEILLPLIGTSILIGVAVALAVKDTLSDAVAGLFLLFDKHFNIGDQIETMKYKGEIINVTLRKTRIMTSDGTIVVLPNRKIDSSGWQLYKKTNQIDKK